MIKTFSLVPAVIVAAALAFPTLADAQGRSRGGGGSSGDSGGSASPRSGPGTGETAVPRSAPAPSNPSPQPSSSQPSSVGTATRSGGSQVRGARAGEGPASTRVRGSQAARGLAQPRTRPYNPGGTQIYVPWSPWYFNSGSYFGYPYYDPWGYSGRYYGSRYGWYDPFLYDPFGYYGAYGYGGMSSYYWAPPSTYTSVAEEQQAPSGSLRIKVNPKDAKVYIDGALAGVADEFDGLTDHLEIAPGTHQLELRADGYRTYTGQVDVKKGRTRTERITLEKQ
jgi:hypothetical protein